MHLDITDLLSFYETHLGQCAQAAIADRVNSLWGDLSGLDVLGIGYAPPFLDRLQGQPRRVISHMSARQGGHSWSWRDGRNACVIARDRHLPFMDAVFDRVLIVHALEETSHTPTLLREVWRVCAPEGRVVIVAPNRTGVWSLGDHTPFGHGRSFSPKQLKRLMRDSLFEPTAWTRSLYTPPLDWRIVTASSEGWERAGEIFVSGLGGVNLVEGIKRLQIEPGKTAKARVVAPVRARPQLRSRPERQAHPSVQTGSGDKKDT